MAKNAENGNLSGMTEKVFHIRTRCYVDDRFTTTSDLVDVFNKTDIAATVTGLEQEYIQDVTFSTFYRTDIMETECILDLYVNFRDQSSHAQAVILGWTESQAKFDLGYFLQKKLL